VTPRARLVVDPTACDGTGVCAELFPERVQLDPWGFPLLSSEHIGPALLDHARRAARACPRMALHLVEEAVEEPPRSRRR
jgi:ferredoxin